MCGWQQDIVDLLQKYKEPHPNPPLTKGGNQNSLASPRTQGGTDSAARRSLGGQILTFARGLVN
jgi:hypothetical protein